MEPATDLAQLVKRGFAEKESQHALAVANGNVDEAMKILTAKEADISWTKETPADWVIGQNQRAHTAEARGLWKSPFYISVPNWMKESKTGDEHVEYTINIIPLIGKSWKIVKRYSEIASFRNSLRYSILNKINNPFPSSSHGLLSFVISVTNEDIENRRVGLEEWFREFCLNEAAMTDTKTLEQLNIFMESNEQPHVADNSRRSSGNANAHTGLPPEIDLTEWTVIPPTLISTVEVTLEHLSKQLPCKIDLEHMQRKDGTKINLMVTNSNTNTSGRDISIKQISKDLSRDRICVQGRKLNGAEYEFKDILRIVHESAENAVAEVNGKKFSPHAIEAMSALVLPQVGRTESAFVCHSALDLLLDHERHPEVIIVPESSLAKPMLLRFRAQPRNLASAPTSGSVAATTTTTTTTRSPRDDWLRLGTNHTPPKVVETQLVDLICDLQATTVFRFTDSTTMNTLLQLRATFCKSIKLVANPTSLHHGVKLTPPPIPKHNDITTMPPPVSSLSPAEAVKDVQEEKGEKIASETLCAPATFTDTVLPTEPPPVSVNYTFVNSKTYMVLEKETKTTTRDWR